MPYMYASKIDEEITDTIFFRERGSNCREHAFNSTPCKLPKCPVNSVKYVN